MESTSIEAGVPNYPLVYAQEPFLRLAIAYNPFNLSDIAKHELVYDQDKSLADYLTGLPDESGWVIGYNGEAIERERWSSVKPAPFSNIVLARVPEGGRSGSQGKMALRIVALIAIAVFAAWAGPALAAFAGFTDLAAATAGATVLTTAGSLVAGAASAAITMAGGMLVNALLPATGGKGQQEESKTYGIDGATNTAKEGGCVPIGYGEYRLGGNIVDMFTRNSGKNQYLFLRTVLNEGEIESIEEIEINGQPLSTFTDVQVRKRFGLLTEAPNDWFDEATRLIQQTIHIDTNWQERTTTGEVDRLRVDVAFPNGLYSQDQNSENKDPRQVTLELEYAPCDPLGNVTGSWQVFPIVGERPVTEAGGGVFSTSVGSNTAFLTVVPTVAGDGDYSIEGFYRPVGTTEWISAGALAGTAGFNFEGNFIPASYGGPVQYTFHFPDAGAYELRVDGGTASSDDGYSISQESIQTSLHFNDKTNQPIRATYEGAILPRGYYKVRIRRTEQEKLANGKQVDFVYDECYLTGIGEIDTTPVNLNGIANLSLCIKANEQLTGIPTVTAKCKLSKVNIYDEDGNVTGFQWSDNPADIVADILHNTIRGAGFAVSKTVWTTIAEFREHCDAEGLKFNGVFDTVQNLWDSVQAVAKVGHGTVVPRGTKYSIAIDRAADPQMVFTPANIFQDSFKKNWLSITDRANEIQLKFSDKDDGFKEATVRLADNAAMARGAKVKTANVSGFGITDLTQATHEAEYYARQNSYVRSFVEFDAPLEAIGITIGDVALIQHDSVDFTGGVGGRFKAGSTTTSIHLDRPVNIETGKNYILLAFHSALKRYTVNITNIFNGRLTVTGLPDIDPSSLARCLRAKQGSRDAEITKIAKFGSTFTVYVDDDEGFSLGSAELWDVDVIEERDVTSGVGEHTIITTQAFTVAPEEFANFMFGEKTSVKQPFRLRSIKGNGVDHRTLSFVQYDERCYQRGGWDVPAISRPVNRSIGHVQGLVADYTKTPLPDQDRIPVTLSWHAPSTGLYGGADVHIFEESSSKWRLLGSAKDGAVEFRCDFSRGESVKFRVVAYDQALVRARFADAPTISINLDSFLIDLKPPTSLEYELWWRLDAAARLTWVAPDNADSSYLYRVQHKPITQAEYDALLGVTDQSTLGPEYTDAEEYLQDTRTSLLKADIARLDLGHYVARVRAEKGFHASGWVYLAVAVEAADIPISVTGLTLVGGTGGPGAEFDSFSSTDANWTWDDILAQAPQITDPKTSLPLILQDYQVRIYTHDGDLIRTEYVSSPSYTYSLAKNAEDTAGAASAHARRNVIIQVRIRGKQGQLGIPATMEVINPAPAVPTGVSDIPDATGVVVSWNPCLESDYAGTLVIMGTEADFAVDGAQVVFDGKASNAKITVTEAGDYFVRVGHYDQFDKTTVNFSTPENLFIPTLAIQDLQNITDAASALTEEVEQVALDALAHLIKYPALDTKLEKLVNLKRQEVGTLIDTERTERIDGLNAFAQVLSLLGAVSGDSLSFILDQETVKVSPTESLGQKLTVLSSSVADNTAQIESDFSTLSTAISSETTARLAMQAQVDANIGAITDEATARATADSAFAQKFSLLGAMNAGATAFILDTSKVNVDATTSLATALSGLSASIASNTAAITAEQGVRASADSANATSITNLTTTVNGFSSSISTIQSSVNGMSAKYGVSLDVNGHITGFVANNNGTSGDFIIVADRFAIVDPANPNSVVVPFSVVNGFANFANPVTVLKTGGSAKLVIGPGFGASSDLVLWYGPASTAIASCTKANATFALAIDGTVVIPSTGSAGFSISANTDYEFTATSSSGTNSSHVVTVTPHNASGSVSYQWRQLSGSTMTISAPTSASTQFSATVNSTNSDKSGTFLCTATDGAGNKAQFTVFVQISYSGP